MLRKGEKKGRSIIADSELEPKEAKKKECASQAICLSLASALFHPAEESRRINFHFD